MTTKKIPNRICVGCRESKEKKALIRIVKTENDQVVLDFTGKMNGRGAYICKNVECLNKAVRSKGLERSLKMPVPDAVYEDLKKELASLNEQ
ncbi:MAG: YlxR family protein [Lachnospiraceae bacterium]|nr:YlxR family protein [Lachnospiraceae bacterium]